MLLVSTHNICFHGERIKIISRFLVLFNVEPNHVYVKLFVYILIVNYYLSVFSPDLGLQKRYPSFVFCYRKGVQSVKLLDMSIKDLDSLCQTELLCYVIQDKVPGSNNKPFGVENVVEWGVGAVGGMGRREFMKMSTNWIAEADQPANLLWLKKVWSFFWNLICFEIWIKRMLSFNTAVAFMTVIIWNI